MLKVVRRILSFGLAVAVSLGISAYYGAANLTVADAAVTDTYYRGITAQSGVALLGQLHDLIVETHKTYTSYDDCRNYGPKTDPGLDGRGVLEFYTHETVMSFVGGVGDWNREHVWCQSLSNGLWGTSGGGSDMHHIRPSESGLNSIRGNNKYGKVSGGKEAWSRDNDKNNSKLGGHVGSGAFEPLDNVKGDVARIVMYVYTHYNNASNVGGTKESGRTHGNLPFTNVISASNESAAKKLLLEWNALDPVDDIEKFRNEEVYKIQGNRNPFIDNSDYAEAIWGDGSIVTPDPSVELKSLSLNATSLTLNAGKTYTLTVTPNPNNASSSVVWTSSDTSVATVNGGVVTAKAAGTATITATSTVNSTIKATATITVMQSSLPDIPTGKATITINSFSSLSGGYDFQSWSAGGIEGTAFIYGGTKDKMQFNIKQKSHYLASSSPTSAPIRAVTVKSASGTTERPWKLLTSSTAYGQIPDGNPSDGNDHGVETVTEEGVSWNVSGNDTYFALVYALEGTTGAGYLDSVVVEYASGGSTEDPPVLESLAVNPSAFSLKEGESTKLTVLSNPSAASAEVSWTSSNTSVATVSADGTVTAVKSGSATITATSTTDSSIKATATVTVSSSIEVTDGENIKKFQEAVAAINADGTLKERRASITAAISAYKNLTDGEVAKVSEDIETLNSAIARYNEFVSACNSADETALKGAGIFL